jgi:hypothetical protein
VDKSKFFDALLKTKYGDKLKKKAKKKSKKIPLSLKALGAAALLPKLKDSDIKYEKKIDKDTSVKLKGNPKKKSIGLWFTKSF